ncbi:MAG: ABC transporter permease [Candidatus Bipolaricaulota bacterium]
MTSYIARRILYIIPTLILLSLVVFAMLEFAPGDPLSAVIRPGASISDATIEAYKETFGLDKPIHMRFISWLSQIFQGNLGLSVVTFRPVTEMIGEKLYPTLLLTFSALLISLLVGIPIGILSAVKRYSFVDYFTTFFAFLGISMPNFFFGLLAIYIFSTQLDLLPFGGMTSYGAGNYTADLLQHLILPSLALGVPFIATIVRFLRSSIIEHLNADYTRTAYSKGLSPAKVLGKHVLRNSLTSTITIITTQLPLLMGGAVVIETVFSWPGMGLLLKHSIYARDYPVIMGFVIIVAVFVIISNLLADIAYASLDPRIRY